MRECPGIYFATEPTGRVAKIGGTALGVWEVLRDFARSGDVQQLREAFHWLTTVQLTAARMYYRRYPDEIRSRLAKGTHPGDGRDRAP